MPPVARRVRLTIAGRVQGVSYRESARQVARSLGLLGWVRNLEDGRVEVLAQGDPESIERLVAWSRTGPPSAVVAAVDVAIEAVAEGDLDPFTVRPTAASGRASG